MCWCWFLPQFLLVPLGSDLYNVAMDDNFYNQNQNCLKPPTRKQSLDVNPTNFAEINQPFAMETQQQ